MGDKNRKMCRFCLKILDNDEFDPIEEITIQMLDVLLLKSVSFESVLDDGMGNVMCLECATKLQNAVDFKTLCISTENKISPFVNAKEELYVMSNSHEKNDSEDQRVCSFCKKSTENGCYTHLHEKKENILAVDMIRNHMPELHLNVTEELIACETCLDSLQNLLSFVMNFLNREDKKENIQDLILKYEGNCSEDNTNKIEQHVNVKNEIDQNVLKTENLDVLIKSEETEFELDPVDSERFKISISGSILNNTNEYESYTCQGSPTTPLIVHTCNVCHYETRDEETFKQHINIHERPLEQQTYLENDLQLHDSPTENKLYKCEMCSHKTKYKYSLGKHMLTHKSPSEINMYKCDRCTYETKYKNCFTRHLLVHQDISESTVYGSETYSSEMKLEGSPTIQLPPLKTYKCEICSCVTKQKEGLKRHMLTHQSPSEITMYQCLTCSYQTKYKESLKRHNLIHQNVSEIQIYRCDNCTYETKYKGGLKVHMRTHQSPTESKMYMSGIKRYKCEICSHETKRKDRLKTHMLSHQNPSDIEMCKCEHCPYESKFKDCLKRHVRIQHSTLEIKVFECEMCTFETKYKASLQKHLLTHQSPSKITMYRCERCSFETKLKSSLDRHIVIHKSPSEIKMYKCDKCPFETKLRSSLKRHNLTHQKNKNCISLCPRINL